METCHILPLGPSSIGKTTLVCSVLDAMRTLFAGRKGGITIQIDDEARLDSCVRALRPAKGALPERLLGLRKEAGLTQRELAEKLKMNSVTYLHYEKGQREPPIDTLMLFADFYSVTVDFLLGRTEY